jgi:hypothetical protein
MIKHLIFIAVASIVVTTLPLNKGYCLEVMSLDSVITADLENNPKTTFNPGDDIRYTVNFTIDSFFAVVLIGGVVKSTSSQEILSYWKFGILPAGTYTTHWDSQIPLDARGTATVSIIFLGIIDVVTIKETTYTVGGESLQQPIEIGSDICALCHPTIADSLQDFSHAAIECEFCHGPGSIHVGSPSPDTIIVDRSSSLCGRVGCHSRGDDQNRIEAEDGLIKRSQQFNELINGGKFFFDCVQCHDPHVSLDSETQEAITIDCTNCHSKTLNHIHTRVGLDCEDCHMPLAVKKITSSGDGDNVKGDGKTHLFTINTTADPSEMFFQLGGGKEYANTFITLNFVCLGCHDGDFAQERDIDWARQAVGLIHPE